MVNQSLIVLLHADHESCSVVVIDTPLLRIITSLLKLVEALTIDLLHLLILALLNEDRASSALMLRTPVARWGLRIVMTASPLIIAINAVTHGRVPSRVLALRFYTFERRAAEHSWDHRVGIV